MSELGDHCDFPVGAAPTLIHNDFKLNNILMNTQDLAQPMAVLDWELSTIGDPLADFTYHIMVWDMPPSPDGLGFGTLAGRDLSALGIPSREAYVEAYRARTGLDPRPHLGVYLAYNFFRLAAILQGIAGRLRDGTAASENAAAMGPMVRPLAAKGWEFAREAAAG